MMGTYDNQFGFPLSPDQCEPWYVDTKHEAEDIIVHILRQAKSGELPESEFERVACQLVEGIDVEGALSN